MLRTMLSPLAGPSGPLKTRRVAVATAFGLVAVVLSQIPVAANAGPLGVIEGQTLDVGADKLDVDIEKGTATLEGHVAATLGDMHVDCSRIELKYDEAPKVRWAKGSGGVTAKLKGIEATAAQFEVDVAHRTIKLSGGVKLSRGRGWVTADSAAIDINTRKVTLEDVKGSIPVQAPER
jgi:lipopolysaccharide export system protein LptA